MNSQGDPETRYLSYMLRLWLKMDGNGRPVWCASLEEPGSHHTESFGDTVSLFVFLQSRLGIKTPEDYAQQKQGEQCKQQY